MFWLASSVTLGCGLDAAGTGMRGEPSEQTPADRLDASQEPSTMVDDPARPRRDAGGGNRPEAGLDASANLDAELPRADATVSLDSGPVVGPGPDAASDAGSPVDPQLPEVCNLGGTYALRLDFDVSWPGTFWLDTYPVYAAGSGKFSMLARMTVANGGTGTLAATLAPCGVSLPDIAGADPAVVNERYGSAVPVSSWSASTMPSWTVGAQASCNEPGCDLTFEPLTALLGAKLTGYNAEGNALVELMDHDADGALGITTISRGPSELTPSGKSYSYMTLGTEARARKQRLVLTMFASLVGKLDSCDKLSGSASGAVAGQTLVGCTGVVRGTTNEVECEQSTLSFVSATYPAWKVSSTRFQAVRIADPSCITVRTALP